MKLFNDSSIAVDIILMLIGLLLIAYVQDLLLLYRLEVLFQNDTQIIKI